MNRLLAFLALAVLVAGVACATGSTTTPGTSGSAGIPKAAEGTMLRKVQDNGKLVAGVKYDQPTFGLLNPATNRLEGFDVDLVKGITREILGSEDKVEFKQAISRDRIPFLEQGVVDLIASTMTANEERAQQVQFSYTYYVAGQSLLVPKNSTINGISGLSGQSVGTVKGSTSEKNISEKAPQANIVLFDTYSEAVAAMDSGRLQAVTTDDSILFGFVYQSPDKYKVVGGQFTIEPYAMAAAKVDATLLEAVNNALGKIMSSGEWARIFEKNFGSLGLKAPPIPPRDWREVYRQAPSGL
jgi:putative glutamine transport system substrate-binding protein